MAARSQVGRVRFRRITVGTTGSVITPYPEPRKHETFPTGYVQVSNEGAQIVRLYALKSDFDADAALGATDGFIRLAATTGFFGGPVALNDEGVDPTGVVRPQPVLWARAEAGTTLVVCAFYLREDGM